jgi:hypothetical protein
VDEAEKSCAAADEKEEEARLLRISLREVEAVLLSAKEEAAGLRRALAGAELAAEAADARAVGRELTVARARENAGHLEDRIRVLEQEASRLHSDLEVMRTYGRSKLGVASRSRTVASS